MAFTEFSRWLDNSADLVTDFGESPSAPVVRAGQGAPVQVPCFTANTHIATATGLCRAGALRVGDKVLTRDNGYQEIRWIGTRRYARQALLRDAGLCPIRIGADLLTDGADARALLVSPQHRLLLSARRQGAGLVCSGPLESALSRGETLVTAESFLRLAAVSRVIPGQGVSYVHFLLDRHEVVLSDGRWSESFRPCPESLRGLDAAQADQIVSAFPDLAQRAGQGYDRGPAVAARPLASLAPDGALS